MNEITIEAQRERLRKVEELQKRLVNEKAVMVSGDRVETVQKALAVYAAVLRMGMNKREKKDGR